MRTVIFLLVLVRLPLFCQELADQEVLPWYGVWQLDPSESTAAEPSPYKRTVLCIAPDRQGVRVAYDMVGTRGGRTHLEWTGSFDGRDYPVEGLDYVLTNAYTRLDDDSFRIVVRLDGQRVATTSVSISRDGTVMTAITTEQDPDGETRMTRSVYERAMPPPSLNPDGSIGSGC